ncbi:MAG: pentapeptide repeat-containing protein [Flavobacterium sp.]|nr:pentapeptide repeat-containing protein [Flavobacterium sp.]
MEEVYYYQETFNKVVAVQQFLTNKEFEDCSFTNCDFANTHFSSSSFTDCSFTDCNLSLIQLKNTGLKNVHFVNCKLIGTAFHEADDFLFQVQFTVCTLDFASFSYKKMPKTQFKGCSLKEVSFQGTQMQQAVFADCDLQLTLFNETNLSGADFTSARNYSIDPEYNTLKDAHFLANNLAGLLTKYNLSIIP